MKNKLSLVKMKKKKKIDGKTKKEKSKRKTKYTGFYEISLKIIMWIILHITRKYVGSGIFW